MGGGKKNIEYDKVCSTDGEDGTKEEADACEYQKLIVQIDCSLCFTFIVLSGIVVNALVVGLIIFAQPRYMIYSMGLFYTAGCMLLYDMIACRKACKSDRDETGDT